MKTGYARQNGFSAITAVVLIVLFALLGSYMVSMSSLSVLNTAQSGSAIQAWFAARAGGEWAVQRALSASAGDSGCSCSAANGSVNFSEGGLAGYTATVTCSGNEIDEAGTNYCVYDLSVTGSNSSAAQLTSASRTIAFSITGRPFP